MPSITGILTSKKFIIAASSILILAGTAFLALELNRQSRMFNSYYEYLIRYVNIERSTFEMLEENNVAVVKVLVENAGDRIIDSLPIEIEYFSESGKLISQDHADLLKFVKDVLFPQKKKSFDISVIYPNGAVNAKVKIRSDS